MTLFLAEEVARDLVRSRRRQARSAGLAARYLAALRWQRRAEHATARARSAREALW